MRHPFIANRTWFIAWWLAWLFLSAGQSALFYTVYGTFSWLIATDWLVSFILFSGLALSLWYPFRYFTLEHKKTSSVIYNHIITGAITVAIWVLVSKIGLSAVYSTNPELEMYWDTTFPYRMATGVFLYLLILLSYYLTVSLVNLSEKNAREARLENNLKETELRLLRSQINPHFLFNSLNSISSLTITDPEKARDMIVKLSEFMRYALSRKDEQLVTLRSELENLLLYLDIEKVRFGDRLTTEELIDEECLDVSIPVLLLQPLFENAIKHGVYESSEMVRITTKAVMQNGSMIVTISNNFSAEPASSRKGTGTGLSNVSRRLELHYGKGAYVKPSRENGIFTATISIPVSI